MNGLTVSFDEYVYRFDPVKGWWVCDQDGSTMSTNSIAEWIKNDAAEEHRRTTSKAQ